jgi:hypothetical protein
MQDEVEAYTDVISERGISHPLMQVPCSTIPSCFFEEGDAIDDDCFGRFKHGTGRQGTATGIGVFGYNYFQIFLAQICTRREWQIDPCKVVCGAVSD